MIDLERTVNEMSTWFRCKIEGISKEQLRPFLTEKTDGDVYLDFSKISPIPENLQFHNGMSLNDGVEMVKRKIIAVELMFHNGMSLNDGVEMVKRKIIAVELMKLLTNNKSSDYNTLSDMFSEWLAWTKKNWGTTVQPIEFEIFGNCIYISTIDSVPIPVFKKLSELLCTKIKIAYASDIFGRDTGRMVFEYGKIVSEFYPENDSNESERIFIESWYYEMED